MFYCNIVIRENHRNIVMKEKKPTKRIVKKDEEDNHKEIRK